MFGRRKKKHTPFVSAIILAAGSASRMEGIDKQTAMMDEMPVVVRSIASFEESPRVREIILVCREELIADYYALVREYDLGKVVSVVGGGGMRQDSAHRGLTACSSEAEYIAVHDGARPLVDLAVIEDCIDSAIAHGAAAAGVPVKDTIKVRDEAGFISSTPRRDLLMAIQTPQIFRASHYRSAMELARQRGANYTDDCQLMEQAGHRVFISRGSNENLKITTPEDLAVASAILQYREEGLDPWQTLE